MPHISKKLLKKETFDTVVNELFKTILKLHVTESDRDFLFQFFTKTERVMLAKRLAIIALLMRGLQPYRIQKTLQVSPSTIARLQLKLETAKLSSIEEVLRGSLGLHSFWEQLEKILQVGMPPMGKGRSKWARDHFPL